MLCYLAQHLLLQAASSPGELAPSIWTDAGQAGQSSAAAAPLFSFPTPSLSSGSTPRIKGGLAPPPGFANLPQPPPRALADSELPSVDSFLPEELLGRKHSRLALWQGQGDRDVGLSGAEQLPGFRDLGPSLAV